MYAGAGKAYRQMPAKMTPGEFIAKSRASELKENAAAQSHFIDSCHLAREPTPTDADPAGGWCCFEHGARKGTGGERQADVWKRCCFAWEYKGKHANLDAKVILDREFNLSVNGAVLGPCPRRLPDGRIE